MSGRDEHDDRDARLAARIDEHWAPAPLDGPGRARFDARLEERIAGDAGRPRLAFAAGVLAVLVLAGWLAWTPGDGDVPRVQTAAADPSWELDLLLVSGGAVDFDDEPLPADYGAIAGAFLDR